MAIDKLILNYPNGFRIVLHDPNDIHVYDLHLVDSIETISTQARPKTQVVLTEALKAERERDRKVDEIRAQYNRAHGLCMTCNCELATHLDRGILMCAHTHREQYEAFRVRTEPHDHDLGGEA
jgi:tryptophanyl-tRNA synthetase